MISYHLCVLGSLQLLGVYNVLHVLLLRVLTSCNQCYYYNKKNLGPAAGPRSPEAYRGWKITSSLSLGTQTFIFVCVCSSVACRNWAFWTQTPHPTKKLIYNIVKIDHYLVKHTVHSHRWLTAALHTMITKLRYRNKVTQTNTTQLEMHQVSVLQHYQSQQ